MKISSGRMPEIPHDLLDEGDAVTVTLGKETFSPVKYNLFEVGPISVTTRVRAGETGAGCAARARRMASVLFEAEFEMKRKEFFQRLEETKR